MAFVRTDLALMSANQNTILGPRMWSYTTIDTDTAVSTEDYFLNAADLLNVGDLIYVNADTDGTPVYGVMRVLQNDGTNVDVADITAWATTDTE